MTAGSEMLLRGPGLVLVLAAAFALSYFIYFVRRWMPALILLGIAFVATKHQGAGAVLLLAFALTWPLMRLAETSGKPRQAQPLGRAEVAAEFAEWNKRVEHSVALLKHIPAFDGRKRKQLAQLGQDAADLANDILGEQRRLRKLQPRITDKAEAARFERVLAAAAPLVAELWRASQDPREYQQAVRAAETDAQRAEVEAAELEMRKWPRHQRLHIRYTGADGRKSERDILPIDIARKGPLVHLNAHCEMRDDYRSFRADRIDEIIDTATGEIIDRGKIAGWLAARAGLPPLHA